MGINLSPAVFWDKYMATGAEFWLGNFYEQRGEKIIEQGEWAEPANDAE